MFFYIIYVHIITKLVISLTSYHKFKVLSELFCRKSAGDCTHKLDKNGGLKKKYIS